MSELRTPRQLAQSAAIDAVTDLAMEWPAEVTLELIDKALEGLQEARQAWLEAEEAR